MGKTKICITCGEEKPATSEYFQVRKDSKDGLRNECGVCAAEYKKQHYLKNKDLVSARGKEYREKNKEHLYETQTKWRLENSERIKATAKRYYEANLERILIREAEYRKANRNKNLERALVWQKDNKDKANIRNQRRKAAARKLENTLTASQWDAAKQHFNNKCCYCGSDMPLEQEHFIPLSKGGEYSLNNIIPACKHCNCSKHNKDFSKWYPTYEHYSPDRENKILEYLNYSDNTQQLSIL